MLHVLTLQHQILVLVSLRLCTGFKAVHLLKLPQGKLVPNDTNPTSEPQTANFDHELGCSPWRYDMFHNSSCVCGDSIRGVVICKEDHVSLLTCHCMSYSDRHDNMTLVGNYPYLCTNDFYTKIFETTNISDLCNRDIQQNRKGQMCGRYLDNYAPSPFSYSFECSNCSNYEHNWVKYIVITYFPLTIFFLAVTIFRLNAMSPSINSFILVCQILSCPATSSLISVYVHFLEKKQC